MTDWPSWHKADQIDLARYATESARDFVTQGFNRYDLARQGDPHTKIAKAIYETLLKQGIDYDVNRYTSEPGKQAIRSPREIIKTRRGTCLDLALLFAGLCLENQLIPILILLEGHALVAVWKTHSLAEWERRKGLNAFDGPITDAPVVQNLIANDAIVAIECTGFAKSEALEQENRADVPESIGRVHGVMTFENAVSAGRAQLAVERPLYFALDLAVMHYKHDYVAHAIGDPPHFDRGQLNRLRHLLLAASIGPDTLREAYLGADRQGQSLGSGSAEEWIDYAVDKLSTRPPAIMCKFLKGLRLGAGWQKKIRAWADSQAILEDMDLPETGDSQQLAEPVVLIKIMPAVESADEESETYYVDAWMFHEEAQPPRHIESPTTEQRLIEADLPSVVDELIFGGQRYLRQKTAEIRVELILPLRLLTGDVENWLIKTGVNRKEPLGANFALALRSYDRLYDGRYEPVMGRWEDHWRNIDRPLPENRIVWDNGDPYGDIYTCMKRERGIFVGLAAGDISLVGELIEAGSAVALWFRKTPADKTAARKSIRKLVVNRRLNEFPVRLRDMRARAENDQGGKPNLKWSDLALLYDDPGLKPPDVESRMRAAR